MLIIRTRSTKAAVVVVFQIFLTRKIIARNDRVSFSKVFRLSLSASGTDWDAVAWLPPLMFVGTIP